MATKPDDLASGVERQAAPSASSPGPLRLRPGPPGSGPATVGSSPAEREPEPYARLLDDYTPFATLQPGEIRQGRVVKISTEDVIVDIGYKSEGLVPLEQFRDAFGRIRVEPGDVIDVMLENTVNIDGYARLSYERAHRIRMWDRLEKAFAEKQPVEAEVVDQVKGGLEVDIGGAKGFLPGSQADLRPTHSLEGWKGKQIQVQIIKLNRKRGNIVVSRRVALEEEINERRRHTLDGLSEGAVVTGTVKNLTDYGAFIDLGGVDGLLHVTDISYGRVSHPSEVLHVGDPLTVKVLKFDRNRQRVSLGVKQLLPDPWETVAERYPANGRAYGRVM